MRELAEKFAPILQIHAGNPLKPVPAEFMLDQAILYARIIPKHVGQPGVDPLSKEKTVKFHRRGNVPWAEYFKQVKKDLGGELGYDTNLWNFKDSKILGLYLSFDVGKEPKDWQKFWLDRMAYSNYRERYPATIYYQTYFDNDGLPIIQYWFFYPYDWWANTHEGDWERIQVKVSSENPDQAILLGLVYHHHEKDTPLAINDPEPYNEYWHVHDNFHPLVWVGGSTKPWKKEMDIKTYLSQGGGADSSGASCPWNCHYDLKSYPEKKRLLKWWPSNKWGIKERIGEPFSLILYPKTGNMSIEPESEYTGTEAYQLIELRVKKDNSDDVVKGEFKNCDPPWLNYPGRWGFEGDHSYGPKGPAYHEGWENWPEDAFPNKPKEVLGLEKL